MNKRFVLSVVALFFASMFTGMVVHGLLLGADYARLGALFSTEAQQTERFTWMVVAHVLIAVGFTWIYRAGRDARPWLGQGVRFGLAVAVMSVIPGYLIYYTVQPMPAGLVVKQVVFDTIAMMVLGIVAAAVNRDGLAVPLAGEAPVRAQMAARDLPGNAIHPKTPAEWRRWLAAMYIRANQWMKKPHDSTSH